MADTPIDWPSLLRSYRAKRGLKQEAAAEIFKVSQATISRWESGAAEPTLAMRNHLFREIRRERSPIDTLQWVTLFRQLLCPGAVTSRDRVVHAATEPLADALSVPREAMEGLRIEDVFAGEILDVVEEERDAGAFAGRVASVEVCARMEANPSLRRAVTLNCHYISWPHFTNDAGIVLVSQGRFICEREAGEVRARLGAPARYTYAA